MLFVDQHERYEMHSELINRLLDLTIAIQQTPAPTFSESSRAALVYNLFLQEGLSEVAQDAVGNIYACIPGREHTNPIVVSAHLDTVFPIETDLQVTQQKGKLAGPGIGDNSLGVAALLGLVWSLCQGDYSPLHDIWLVANVGEEGLGDLRGMRSVVRRFNHSPLAYIVLEGMALGQIYSRGLGVLRYAIEIHTRGGHSWVNHGQPSAIHEIVKLADRLIAIPIPTAPRTIMNIGIISGGLSINTIAPTARIEIDLRSEDQATLDSLAASVVAIAKAAHRREVDVSPQIIGNRPPGGIPADHPLVEMAVAALEEVGVEPRLNIGSTDANIPLSLGIPAVCLGITHGDGAHTQGEMIYTQPIKNGLKQLVSVIKRLDRGY